MASIYVLHRANQFPTTPPGEGLIYPLLRKVDETHVTCAFAVPQPTETDSLEKLRKNRLICAALRSLGFVLDENNASSGKLFDFYHLADDQLVDSFDKNVFDTDTFPELTDSTDVFSLLPPRAGKPELKLQTTATKDIKPNASVKVQQFVFANSGGLTPGHFDLGLSGQPTSPGFTANITLEPDLKSEFPSGTLPVLTFDQSGVAGALRCNTVEVIASNKMPGSATTIAADVRHDRLTVDVATLVCTEPDTDPKLAIEVFPTISFQPDANLPVTVSISNDGVCLRLQPRGETGDELDPRLKVNRFKPCVSVTVRGPVIHADASGTGALESLRLLEPAERKIGETVEQINDFLVYSFEVCLPESSIPEQTLPEIFRFEKLGFKVPNWPRMDGIDFSTYLKQLIGGLPLPRLNVAPRRIDFSLEEFQLPGLELNDILSLPDNIQGWKLALRRLDAPELELPIDSVELSGFTLTVNFSANVNPNIALQLPRFSLPSVTFPDVGLPALTEYDFRQFAIDDGKLKVTLPSGLDGLLPDRLPHLWTVRVKRPGGLEFDLMLTAVNVTGLEVEFTIEGELAGLNLRVGLDLLRIKWSIPFAKPSLSVNELTLDLPFPRLRLPEVQGPDGLVIDYRLLTIRARLNGVDLATYTINNILDLGTFKKLELNVPKVNGHYPDLEPLTLANVTLEFGLDLSLPLTKCFLSDLLGDLGSVDFRLSVPRLSLPQFDFAALRVAFGSLATPMIPLELVVRVPHPTKSKLEWDELKLVLGMRFDLSKFRLLDNRIYFFLPQRRSKDANLAPRQVMDFDIFTLTFPNRPAPLGYPTKENHDGYLDLTSREFVIDLKYPEPLKPTPPPRIHAFFPGGMDPKAARLGREGVENRDGEIDETTYKKFVNEYTKRFDLELDEVDPKLWPNTGPDRLMFRFNSNGLTFAANLGKTEVIVDQSGADDPQSSNGLIKPFKFQPQDKQRELRSRLVIIDNELKEAGVYAKTEVPGVENLMAEVSVVLRQRQKGMLPEVLASMELERADEAPLAEFSIKLLELSLDRLELGLIWRMQEREWDYSIIADGTIGFTEAAALVPDLEGLRVPSIQVVGLDLRRMNLRQLRVPINLVKPVRFDILDGMFGVELGDLEIGWEFDGEIPKPRLLACELAKLTFKNPGALEVSVSVGGLHIEFDEYLKARVKLPSSLGIEVALGTSAKFAGRVGWVDKKETGERFLFASGKLMLEGLPEVRGLLKFGTGLKHNGRPEINLVLYGEMDLDEQLFSGAVVKSLGLGVGLNNRLAALPPTPSADAILRRIDLVKPGELEGWQFVREGGFYMSVIGSVTLASNLGEPDVLNAYVAALVVSIDTNFDLVAAGKLWLSCSVKGQKDNPNNPAFVGAMVLSPRQRKLEVVLESRKNAYVEQNDLIKKLLDKGFVRFAFRMTPQLVDFHLAEVSYRDQMFGVDMEFRGEYRFAIFKRAVLLKNELSATGSISKSLSGGAGGFDLDGQAYLRLGYGGLLSDRGAMAYAFIEAGIRFRVSAWIEIGFSISFKICGKRYSKSWTIVFRTRVPQLELTLRGHVAIADRGGFGGFDLLVGINVPICGYRLNVTVGWALNAELYQEVRAQVAAFEAELEAAVKAIDGESKDNTLDEESISSTRRQIDKRDPAQVPALSGMHISSVGIGAGINARLNGIEIHPDAAKVGTTPTVSESWLLYSREFGDKSTALLVPAADGSWLTPMLATIQEVIVRTGAIFSTKETNYAGSLTDICVRDLDVSSTSGHGQGSAFDVAISDTGEVTLRMLRSGEDYAIDDELTIVGTDLLGGATPADDIRFKVAAVGRAASFATHTGQTYRSGKVRLIGLRGKPVLDVLNNSSWEIKASDNASITLDIDATEIDATTYSGLLGGVWRIDESETVSGLSPEDHDTVPYIKEVERAVLRTSRWLRVIGIDENLVTFEPVESVAADAPTLGIPDGNHRVVIRKGDKDQPMVDPGKERIYSEADNACVTLAATFTASSMTASITSITSTSIEVGWQLATAIEIAPPWSARNRLAALRDPSSNWEVNEYRDYTGAATAWAETAAKADDGEIASTIASYAVVFDERYTAGDPRFSPADAPVEPGVLSTRFRPIDDVEAVGVDSVLESARRFEEASRSVARQYLHGAFDLDDQEAIQQARAQATQLLVHRLSDPRGPESNDRSEAPVVEFKVDEQHKVVYGWFCKSQKTVWENVLAAIGANGSDDVLFVRRAGGGAIPVTVRIPDNKAIKEENKPTPLPIRQDLVIDDASEVHERGRVIIRLPIRYEDDLLRRRPQDVGRLQVYRRIGDGPEELVFDQLRPEICQLDKKQIYSKTRQQFVDDLAAPRQDRKDYLFTGDFSETGRLLTISRDDSFYFPPDPKDENEPHPLENLFCRIGLVSFRIEIARRREVCGEIRMQFTLALGTGPTPGQHEDEIELIADGLIVPRPVLISDEFKVTDRQFDSAELRSALGSERAPLVQYSLVALSEDDTGGAKPVSDRYKRINWPAPVPLYIPTRKEPLPNLALAIPVSSLLQDSAGGVTFQLVDLSEETPKLAERDGRPLSAKEFEFWLDGDILRQSGFYAGEAADPNPPREGDGERVTLDAVNSTDGFESTAGKLRVDTQPAATTSRFQFVEPSSTERIDEATVDPRPELFLPGAAFRVFFREKGDTSVRSLRRLPILLVREFPRYWDATVRYRLIDTAEIIPSTHERRVGNGEAIPHLVDFSADDRYEAGRAAIRSVWPSLSLLEGGVELQFRDFDDSSMRSRTLVEVLEADEFSQSQTDFRDDTFWTPRPPDRVERYVSRVVAKDKPKDENEFRELLKNVYLWKRPKPGGRVEESIDVVRRLEKAKDQLLEANGTLHPERQMQFKPNEPKWSMFATAVRSVQTALLSFEKSPLNLNSVALRQRIELLRLKLRAVVVGNKVGPEYLADVPTARAAYQSLLELLTRVEQSRAETVSDTDANDVAFLDRDTARKLAGIVRRRIAIADDAMALLNIDVVPQSNSVLDKNPSDPMARQEQWETIIKDAESLAGIKPLPVTASIASLLSTSHNSLVDDCRKQIDGLKNEIEKLDMKSLVPRAAGLSELLYQLNEKIRVPDTPAGLLKRPHHELTTTKKEDGEIVAREVQLRDFLPARARQAKLGTIPEPPDEHLERLGIRAGHVATLFANGNVAIWTTRGQSVRDEPMERVQYFATGATEPKVFELSEVAQGPRMLISATFEGTPDVQLWDAGEAKVLRKYGGAIGAAFAATPRGLEVAAVHESMILLETTESSKTKHQVKYWLSKEVLDRLQQYYSVLEGTINKLQTRMDTRFEDEQEFRDAIAATLSPDELKDYWQSILNQAQDPPLPFKTPLLFKAGGESKFNGPVAYHDELQVVAASRGNEILFWRDMGRPENSTPFFRWKLAYDIQLHAWRNWGDIPTEGQCIFHATLAPSGRLHIRRFDSAGVLLDTFEELEGGTEYLVSMNSSREVLSRLKISELPEHRSKALTAFKEKIRQSATSRVFDADARNTLHHQAALITDLVEPEPSVTQIESVTLPSGAGFVIATANFPRALFFLDPLQRRAEPVGIREGVSTISQLAVDRRGLTASVVIDGQVCTYDLLSFVSFEKWAGERAACHVAVLLGRQVDVDESFLVVPSGGDLHILADSASNLIQSLPAPVGLGEETTARGDVVAIASHLMTARTATAAGDPLSLFHLWERMGFALDVAAQDNLAQLVPLTSLRGHVRTVVQGMGSEVTINGERHYVYLVEGEEPDAEFRDDRVGFSHVNVAVVPEQFIAACLDPDTAAIEKWLDNRSIKLALADSEKQRELEYLTHMTQLVGVPHSSRFGTLDNPAEALDAAPVVPHGGELRLQPRSDRFVRVPASAGFSHWSWTLPDRKGHRMLVAARRVSRYEPLLRWWLNLHTRFDLPEEVALGGDLTIINVNDNQVTVDRAIPLETGWQPLRLEIVKGDGAGQRRELLPIPRLPETSRSELLIDSGDPWLDPKPKAGAIARVMDAAPGWRLVVLDPIHDPARGEGPRPLMVYQYSHSRKPRFSYQIPLDGMRATYNQISRVRTGYHGIEAAFRYYLPDRIDDPQAPLLDDLLAAIESSADTPTVPSLVVTTVSGGAEPDVRLFRHERMVSLPGLPFFYRYRLDVRSAYKARTLEYAQSTAAERLPDDENASPPAQRLPACLGLNEMTLSPMILTGRLPANQPTDTKMVRLFNDGEFEGILRLRVRPSSGDDWIERSVEEWQAGVLTVVPAYPDQPAEGWEYELEVDDAFEAVVYLSANRDHLTREEARSEPNPVQVKVCENYVDARQLPDFFMDYHLYRNQKEGAGSLPSLGDLFSVIGSIRMPWSPNFPSTAPVDSKMRPFVSVASGVKLVNIVGGGSPTVAGQESSFAIERVTINGLPYWRLRFWIANEPGQDILARNKVYIQASRDGKLTRAIKCLIPE